MAKGVWIPRAGQRRDDVGRHAEIGEGGGHWFVYSGVFGGQVSRGVNEDPETLTRE